MIGRVDFEAEGSGMNRGSKWSFADSIFAVGLMGYTKVGCRVFANHAGLRVKFGVD
jgi:hypothetical protein